MQDVIKAHCPGIVEDKDYPLLMLGMDGMQLSLEVRVRALYRGHRRFLVRKYCTLDLFHSRGELGAIILQPLIDALQNDVYVIWAI